MALGIWLNGTFQRHLELLITYLFATVTDVVDNDIVIFDKFNHSIFRNMLDHDVYPIDHKFKGSWSQLLEDDIATIEYLGIDTMIIFKTDLRDNFRYGHEGPGSTFMRGVAKNDKYSSTFLSSKSQIENILFVKASSIVCDNVYQYALDPDEARLDQLYDFNHFRRLYFNACEKQNAVFVPYYEYAMVRDYSPIETDDKYLFCFHATANNDRRQWLADMKDELESLDNYNVHIKRRGEGGTSTQSSYMNVLQRSKYTMVIAAYNPDSFSWPRLFEAASVGCLPFVMSDCNLTDIEAIYPDVCDIIRSELFVDDFAEVQSRMKSMKESTRRQLVSDIMNSDSVKKITDYGWMHDRWSQLKGLGGTV